MRYAARRWRSGVGAIGVLDARGRPAGRNSGGRLLKDERSSGLLARRSRWPRDERNWRAIEIIARGSFCSFLLLLLLSPLSPFILPLVITAA